MKLFNRVLATVVLGFGLSTGASANLIVNGSFEETNISGTNQQISQALVPGWKSDRNIEIWNNLFNFAAFDGKQLIELNSVGNGPHSIFQSFSTQVGLNYVVSFAFAARDNANEAFNAFIFDSVGNEIVKYAVTNPIRREWSVATFNFVAASNITTLTFTSVTPTNSVGNLLDNVRVVPEPSALLLFGLTALCLAVRSRKVK